MLSEGLISLIKRASKVNNLGKFGDFPMTDIKFSSGVILQLSKWDFTGPVFRLSFDYFQFLGCQARQYENCRNIEAKLDW